MKLGVCKLEQMENGQRRVGGILCGRSCWFLCTSSNWLSMFSTMFSDFRSRVEWVERVPKVFATKWQIHTCRRPPSPSEGRHCCCLPQPSEGATPMPRKTLCRAKKMNYIRALSRSSKEAVLGHKLCLLIAIYQVHGAVG